MPLHRDYKIIIVALYCLYYSIPRSRRNSQTITKSLDSLMMSGVRFNLFNVENSVQFCVGHDLNYMPRGEIEFTNLSVISRASQIGQILVQCPAKGDIENLQPSADSENGNVSLYTGLDDSAFKLIAAWRHRFAHPVKCLAVRLRVHILTTDQQQSIDPVAI